MAKRDIKLIVIHCAATPNGKPFTAKQIDEMHAARGFRRYPAAIQAFNPELPHIGYHWFIRVDGLVESGRSPDEAGAHVKGYNADSLGICMAGTDQFGPAQWESLRELVAGLRAQYPAARICGHRDLSPDRNGDGKIDKTEWVKLCPGFDVAGWLAKEGV